MNTDTAASTHRVAIHQPNYWPWLGYFSKIEQADTFIFLDDAQFSKNGYINRCRIMGPKGPQWLSIPVHGSTRQTIAETAFASGRWRQNHIKTLQACYAKAPYFEAIFEPLETEITKLESNRLAKGNIALIKWVCGLVGLRKTFYNASGFSIQSSRTERLIELVRAVEGTEYICGFGAVKYQAAHRFEEAAIALRTSIFNHPQYKQFRGDFVSGLSILDALFNLGAENTGKLIREASHA